MRTVENTQGSQFGTLFGISALRHSISGERKEGAKRPSSKSNPTLSLTDGISALRHSISGERKEGAKRPSSKSNPTLSLTRRSANIRLGLPGNLVYSVDKSAVDDGRREKEGCSFFCCFGLD
ncbi:hypothetical protein QE152_g27240 [Popillia japonica]|uniref:Uncharacterized protein n=1 Tax=Popillia japonica TaxID=7064 RepID=A0AAW1JVZ5_POPJA